MRLVETLGDVVGQCRILEPFEAADLDGDEGRGGAVVADVVALQVFRCHAVDLPVGNGQIGGVADEELVPDHMRFASLRIAALHRELVVAGGQFAEVERMVA